MAVRVYCVNIVVQFWMQFKFTFPRSLFECYSFYKVQASYIETQTKEVSVFWAELVLLLINEYILVQ